jgi:hypothetical protein
MTRLEQPILKSRRITKSRLDLARRVRAGAFYSNDPSVYIERFRGCDGMLRIFGRVNERKLSSKSPNTYLIAHVIFELALLAVRYLHLHIIR